MDPQLSLLMINQAQVKNGHVILDPFVGTGSLLVAAAEFGGYSLGADIDFMMLHGRTRPTRISQKVFIFIHLFLLFIYFFFFTLKPLQISLQRRSSDESVAANMEQYGKRSHYLDVVVSDFSRPMWKPEMRVDAIITDRKYNFFFLLYKIN